MTSSDQRDLGQASTTINTVTGAVTQLLEQAQAAAVRRDWPAVQSYAQAALSFEAENQDALAFVAAAQRNLVRPADVALLFSPARLLLFSLVSGGLYIFYWFFRTWKQLKSGTSDEDKYPIWHALSLLVPIYCYVQMHSHLEVIQEVIEDEIPKESRPAGLKPWFGVALLFVGNIAGFVIFAITSAVAVVALQILLTLASTVLVLLAQTGLNSAWLQKYPGARNATISWAEVVLAAIGILVWIGLLAPAE